MNYVIIIAISLFALFFGKCHAQSPSIVKSIETLTNRNYAKIQSQHTDLAPGNYTLYIAQICKDGVSKEENIAIELVIYEPWWLQIPFQVGLSLLLTGLICVCLCKNIKKQYSEINDPVIIDTDPKIFFPDVFCKQEFYGILSVELKTGGTILGEEFVEENVETTRHFLEDEFVMKVHQEILSRIDDYELDVTKLCREIGVCRSSLHKKLKAITGQSTTEFIRYTRLHKGRELLLATDLSVSSIAYEIGFSTPGYFSRKFSALFGESPSAYRENRMEQ